MISIHHDSTAKARQQAEELTFTTLLNHYIREFGNSSLLEQVPRHDPSLATYMRARGQQRWMRIELPATRTDVYCPLAYHSDTGSHRFQFPVVALKGEVRELNFIDLYRFSTLVTNEQQANARKQGQELPYSGFAQRLPQVVSRLEAWLKQATAERSGAMDDVALADLLFGQGKPRTGSEKNTDRFMSPDQLQAFRSRFPGFDIITGHQSGRPLHTVAALCEDAREAESCRLAEAVKSYAVFCQWPVHKAAERWFDRFLGLLLDPLICLYSVRGLVLEAPPKQVHVELDIQGAPHRVLLGPDADRHRVLQNDESVSAQCHRLFISTVFTQTILGIVACLGRQGLGTEAELLSVLQRRLQSIQKIGESDLLHLLLESRSWQAETALRRHLGLSPSAIHWTDYPNPLIPLRYSCKALIYPVPGKILFTKYFPDQDYTLTLRGYDHELDFEIVYDWVNQEYAKTFWQMNGTRQQLEGFYLKNLASDYTCSIVGLIDGVQAFIAEPYWPMRDPMGAYYNARPDDYGFHFIKRPVEPSRNKLFLNAFRTSVEFMFSFPEVQRVVGEADHLNDKINDMCVSMGYTVDGLLVMPWKTAKLTICTREGHAAQFPEVAASLLAPAAESY